MRYSASLVYVHKMILLCCFLCIKPEPCESRKRLAWGLAALVLQDFFGLLACEFMAKALCVSFFKCAREQYQCDLEWRIYSSECGKASILTQSTVLQMLRDMAWKILTFLHAYMVTVMVIVF